MRKYKGLFVSVSMAAMLMTSGTVFAEETETTEVVTEVASETEAASESASEEVAVESEAQAAEEVVEGGISASDRASLESYAQQSIEMIVGMDDAQAEEILHPSSILSKYQDSMVASVQSWVNAKEELGAYKQILAQDIEVDDDIVIKTDCEFENGESVVTTTLSLDDLSLVSMEFATAEKTMGQKMEEAVLNTLMGVCVVFVMLFFLSFLISQFKHISKLEEGFKKKNAPAAPAPAPVAAPAPVEEEEVADDGELIAVIAAAIAAAEGTSTDGFVVRSIKKSNRNKWQRA
ncbi:Na+-transporting methylmalonyl-CoA/oxaloacetate decarboxylase%2C gamma subunit [uncultured Clostridium sp.]|uniref:OadG family protein n=1 Tax=Muricoprocola aceti TaxID=2981772 RepID=A0ABT2SNX2_9FIRM|nr:OadG family protein [Muricoprocola aceti]MCU6726219.1 OadG family protein [Muricoprocola aceti]SCH81794.1 Na+-transporting methylmalonyl-CoA/oxaloacetate decarboxylase%2C gamma subunit [uncultured Clostridium sp.]